MSNRFLAVVALAAALAALGLVPGAAASAQPAAVTAALDHVRANAADFGATGADVGDLVVTDVARSEHSGVTHVYLRQTLDGLGVLGTSVTVNVGRDGRVIAAAGSLVRDLAEVASGRAELGAVESAEAAAEKLGLELEEPLEVIEGGSAGPVAAVVLSDGGIAEQPIPASLAYHALANGSVRLVWNVEIAELSGEHWWNASVDAATGALLVKEDYVIHDDLDATAEAVATTASSSSATEIQYPLERVNDGSAYNVFPLPLESPNDGPRALVENPADALASPWGWHDTNGAPGPEFTITRGNNVHAYADVNNVNAPSASFPEPNGGPGLLFDNPLDLDTQVPSQYRAASVTNLFYWCNVNHDVWYRYGFTEQFGNFQVNNYGRTTFTGGNNDDVRCEAQDGGGTNNANFSPGTDGQRGRMQMYLWPGALRLSVDQPSSAAGNYTPVAASFGPTLASTGPKSGQLVIVNGTVGLASEGCGSITGFPAGAIAIIDRGNCPFVEKVKNAQDAGAIAAVVVNNVTGAAIAMGGTDPTITIPSVMVTLPNGNTIKAGLPATGTLRLNLTRDGDFDAGIVTHEYGHGVSIRLTGGRTNSSCLGNQEQMGEGWSDYLAIALTAVPTDSGPQRRGMGTYALFQDDPLRAGNGIRPTPYSTNMSINPATYDTIRTAAIPHGIGYVWATMLWEVYWDFVDAYGFNPNPYGAWDSGGNNLAMQLVMDGMKIQPCSPGFVNGRDAILTADQALTGGANKCLIWRGFAKRGLGVNAVQGSSNNRTDNTQGFQNHADCRPQVARAPASFSKGVVENTQVSDTLTVSNLAFQHGEDLTWTITEAASDCSAPSDLPWVGVAQASGTTAAAGSTEVAVTFDATGLVAPAVHTGKLCLASNGGATLEVPLTLQTQYAFTGFLPPLGYDPNVAQAGNARPVKFSLAGDHGLGIFAGPPASQRVDCTTRAPVGPVESLGGSGSSGLQYDPLADEYTYVWKTQKSWAGTCRQLLVTLNDASATRVAFLRFQ